MATNRYPCLFLKLDETDAPDLHYKYVDPNGREALFMIEFADRGRVWFPDMENGKQFIMVHGLEPVEDAQMALIRESSGR